MKAIEITPSGKLTEKELDRKALSEKFGIHSRDLRPVFSKKQITSITPWGKCIVVSIRSVKLLISLKEVSVFNLEKNKIPEYFIPLLVEKITAWKKANEKIRFEHLVLEVVLLYIIEKMNRRFEDLERLTEKLFCKLRPTKVTDQTLEQLLHLKKRISQLETIVEEIESELTDLLEEDEELSDMYLQETRPKNTDEIESILESNLEQIEDVSHRIDDLNENIDDTQEILTLKLDHMRNTIIRLDLVITSITGILAIGAVVTGLYGMNLHSGLETSKLAFHHVTLALIGIFILCFIALITWFKKKKIL